MTATARDFAYHVAKKANNCV